MYTGFKENIIHLMQYTDVLHIPLYKLCEDDNKIVQDLLTYLIDPSVYEDDTILDYMQLARLHYNLAESESFFKDEVYKLNCKKALEYIEMSGIDLSMDKWLELEMHRANFR